jgi:hypothetical protein
VRTIVRVALACQVAVALLSAAGVARAERPKDALARLRAQADTAYAEGRFADSRDAWLAVWRIERSQMAACNIGALSFRIGDAPAAVRWLTLCKEIMRPPTTPEERALHESRMVDLERARLLVGALRIVAPAGATLTIDGKLAEPEHGKDIPVTPGRHVVRAELNGATTQADVDVARGETREVKLDFAATQPKGPAPSTAPDVAIRTPSPVPPGPSLGLVMGWVAASTTFLALGGGLMALSAGANEDKIAAAQEAGPNKCLRLSQTCLKAASYQEDVYRFRGATIASFVVGGLLAAATIGYVVYSRQRTEITASAEGIVVKGVW